MTDLRGTGDASPDRAVRRALAGSDAPPGACVGVSVGGRVRWSSGGVAQAFDDRGPLTDPPWMDLSTRSDIGSVTKLVGTTLAVMRLVDTGSLGLADTIGELLPELVGTAVAGASVQELLEHRAGLWEWWPTYLERARMLDVVADLPLRYPPNTGRHYSDLGFLLLGEVVSAVAGAPLAAAVQQLVLDPVALTATSYVRPAPGVPVAASSTGDRMEREMVRTGHPYPVTADPSGFAGWRSRVLVGEINDGNAFHSCGSIAGHAGMFSTAADLLAAGDAVLAGLRGDGLISPSTTRLFLETGAVAEQALGFRRWPTSVGTAYGHTGFPGVAVAVLPDRQLTAVLVTNRLHVAGRPIATEPLWSQVLTMLCRGEE
jgi:CubicO group peptidase (beta-lactamase class C family)